MAEPFQGSDVPLTEDILKKKLDFVKTWVEFAAENFIQVVKSGRTNTNTIIFTVPDKETLYITSARLQLPIQGDGLTTQNIASLSISGKGPLLSLDYNEIIAGYTSISNEFPMPIQVEQGATISLSVSGPASDIVTGGFTGFLVPKRISP